MHLQLQGESRDIPRFVAYLKRELTNRWGAEIGWGDTLWKVGYLSTALVTADGQERCFEYVLSHGVKERIVSRPEQWTGLHAAQQLVSGQPLVGDWVDGTRYGKALWKERQKWRFQVKYRKASDAYLAGDRAVEFPAGSFLPPVFAPPPAEMDALAG